MYRGHLMNCEALRWGGVKLVENSNHTRYIYTLCLIYFLVVRLFAVFLLVIPSI